VAWPWRQAAAGGGLTAAATVGRLQRLRWPGKRLEGTAWPAVVTRATLLHTVEEEERERSASSSGILPGSAMVLAGSEAEKRGRGRMERVVAGSGLASPKRRARARWRLSSKHGQTTRRLAPAHGRHEGHAARIQNF